MAGVVAVFTTAGLGVGTHIVTASYGGNSRLSPSLSNTVAQVVNLAPVVVGLQRNGVHLQPTRLLPLTFNCPMNAATVQDVRNYLLYPIGQRLRNAPRPSESRSPRPSTTLVHRSVTLSPRSRLALRSATPGRRRSRRGWVACGRHRVPLVADQRRGQDR